MIIEVKSTEIVVIDNPSTENLAITNSDITNVIVEDSSSSVLEIVDGEIIHLEITDNSLINIDVHQEQTPSIDIIEENPITVLISEIGLPGVGVPAGGTTGQVLAKKSNSNYDTEWISQNANEAKILVAEYTVAETSVSALQAVRAQTSTSVVKAKNDGTFEEAQAIGVAITGGSFGQTIRVQYFGALFDGAFNFPLNAPIFLGSLGQIVADPGVDGEYNTRIGKSLGNGAIFIDIREPILI